MSKNEVHEMLMGVAVVVLGYALYKHFKPTRITGTLPSAADVAASDQSAIDTALSTMPDTLPGLSIPAPIPVQGGAGSEYTASTGGWLSNLDDMLKGAL